MAIRKIATIGHPVLREKARTLTLEELKSPKTQQFIDDLIETMVDANGAGIAANQVYEPIRICTIWVKDNPRYPYKPNVPLTILVNPVVEILGGEQFDNYEGCLSVPNLRGEVKRTMMMDDGRTKEIDYSIRVYSLHELGKILNDSGFRVAEVSGRASTPGVFFGNESPRTLILAEKR